MKLQVKKLFHTLWVAALLTTATACSEEEDCSLNARPMMQCNLYTLHTESGMAEAVAINQLTVTAAGTDSVIINRMENVQSLSLPLRYGADSTQLVFHYSDGRTDHLLIRHTNTPYFLSMECGYQMKQRITGVSYTKVLLDSIAITYNEAGIYERENLKLFY